MTAVRGLVSEPSSHVVEREFLTYLWGKAMDEPWEGGERALLIRVQANAVSGWHVHLAWH